MNRTTVIMVALALGSVGLAWNMRPRDLAAASFEDTGAPLFPGFTDPTLATALEVVSWDDKAAKVMRFAVEQKSGRWVIPSHNDYPADGTERMGKAAASFIDVKKDLYYGDNAAEHGQYGVLDPESADGKGDEKGKHITIKDASGATLVAIIVGKEIPEKQGFFYVRSPEEKRVYGARLELDISTNFTDWIEKDLLKVKRDEIVTMLYDPYTVDEQQGKVTGSAPVRANLTSVDGKDEWVAEPGVEAPDGKIVDSAKVRQMITAISSIKIVGVRPRPKPLTLQALQSKGFFVTPDGARLFGNEGEARVVTKDGIVFSLYFGEITYESGLALTAGADDEAPDEPTTPELDGGKDDKAANRYMFVEVAYDPSMDKGEEAPVEEPEDGKPAKPSVRGQDRAKQLQARFGEWFYVISDMSYKQIHKDRGELFKGAPAPKETPAAPTGGTTPAPGGAATDKPAPAKDKPAPKAPAQPEPATPPSP